MWRRGEDGANGEPAAGSCLYIRCRSRECGRDPGRDRCDTPGGARQLCRLGSDCTIAGGVITVCHKGGKLPVELDGSGHVVLGHLAARLRRHKIRLLPFDRTANPGITRGPFIRHGRALAGMAPGTR
jgi:translation initiation factor IF-1